MKKRVYSRRKREHVVNELDDVRAVRGAPPRIARPTDLAKKVGNKWRPFEAAGWTAVEADSIAEEAASAARVLLEADGRVVLSEGVLTVKFGDEVDSERIQEIVSGVDGEIVESLPIAPNLFRIRIPDTEGRDSFGAAESLSALPECEFAEVELIEPFVGR